MLRSVATEPLPKRSSDRLELLDALLSSQALSGSVETQSHFLDALLGDAWRGDETDLDLLLKTALTIERLAAFDADLDFDHIIELAHKGVASAFADDFESGLKALAQSLAAANQALDLGISAIFRAKAIGAIDLERLADRAAQWAIHPARFEEWTRLAKADRQMRAIGPALIADGLASGALQPARACAKLEAAFAEASWKQAIAANPDLAAFDGERHNSLIAIFKTLEARQRRAAALSVRARHQAETPRGARAQWASSAAKSAASAITCRFASL
ncbi:MAG: hypothetical protein ACREDI_14885 [Roseiarcus sp.]